MRKLFFVLALSVFAVANAYAFEGECPQGQTKDGTGKCVNTKNSTSTNGVDSTAGTDTHGSGSLGYAS